MKYLYVCEKCGRQFDDYEIAVKCETSHLDIDHSFHEFQVEMDSMTKWSLGAKIPSEVVLATPCIGGPLDEDENPTCEFALYKVERSLTASEVRKIVFAYNNRKTQLEDWMRRRDEKRESV